MQSDSRQPSLNARLISIGISESYASLLANGVRTPSLALAKRIERELGIPATSWEVGTVPQAPAAAQAEARA